MYTAAELIKLIDAVLYRMCREGWALHVVIKQKIFFTFIFAIFLPYFMLSLLVTLV